MSAELSSAQSSLEEMEKEAAVECKRLALLVEGQALHLPMYM